MDKKCFLLEVKSEKDRRDRKVGMRERNKETS